MSSFNQEGELAHFPCVFERAFQVFRLQAGTTAMVEVVGQDLCTQYQSTPQLGSESKAAIL